MSAIEEHLATRRAAGLFDFSFMGLYEFSGTQALARLQSRDLSNVQPGRLLYTLLLNEDGSVFNDATVWRLDADRWWLFTGRRSDFERLRPYARDHSGEHTILAVQGPSSGRILAQRIGIGEVRNLNYFHFTQTDSAIVARLGYSGELGYELLVPAADASRLRAELLDLGREYGLVECSWTAADSLRIEAGYVLFDREIDGQANPRELGLERLVSKPARFSLSRRLVGLEMLEPAAPRDLPSARVTSEAFSPLLNRTIALGFAAPGVPVGVSVRLADGRTARLARLPFYDPERRVARGTPF